uniref:Uncharacterized protein n=1 Tax=Anguilla anguilla TaxID=7936 RepID=A0A0E9T308_ANGAN
MVCHDVVLAPTIFMGFLLTLVQAS